MIHVGFLFLIARNGWKDHEERAKVILIDLTKRQDQLPNKIQEKRSATSFPEGLCSSRSPTCHRRNSPGVRPF